MSQYVMKGGNPLSGEVLVAGAKNAALGILAGAIMTNDPVTIENVPMVQDIEFLLDAIRDIGGTVECRPGGTVMIDGSTIRKTMVNNDYIQKLRGGYYLVGALLGKYHHAEVDLPGGCNIGSRPIDQHIKGFRAIGADVKIRNGMILAHSSRLVGAHIYLDIVSVGATINIMLAASTAEGKTIIENAAKEPHVVDVANMLNSMGANIKGAGTDTIRIRGVEKLHGSEYSIIPDQIEAGTYMIAAAATRGEVLIRNVIPKHLEAITAKLREIGVKVTEYDDSVLVQCDQRLGYANVKTLPYPGFPTDMQPQVTSLLALSDGVSIITETIFENRFKYVTELRRMGANINVEGNIAIITGVEDLTGAAMNAPDLRAGAALVIAALTADEFSTVDQIHYIERGFERFDEKLQGVGAKILRVDEDDVEEQERFKLQAM